MSTNNQLQGDKKGSAKDCGRTNNADGSGSKSLQNKKKATKAEGDRSLKNMNDSSSGSGDSRNGSTSL